MIVRILSIIVILVSILVLPYWLYLPLVLLAMVFFPLFWEAIPMGFLVSSLYGQAASGISLVFSPFAIAALVLVIAMIPIRERLRL